MTHPAVLLRYYWVISETVDGLLAGKLITLMTAALLVLVACSDKTEHESAEFRQFKDIYEPSGVQWVPGVGVILIEDEIDLYSRVLQFDNKFQITGSSQLRGLPAADDLEGLTATGEGVVYAITSHSIRSSAKRDSIREKLLKYTVTAGSTAAVSATGGTLRNDVITTYPQIRSAMDGLPDDTRRFNIESLAYQKTSSSLLIGFRSPLLAGQAIVVQLDNPSAYIDGSEPAAFASDLIHLDLDGGGIRAMVYDETLGGYLIASRHEKSEEGNFALWLWSDDGKIQRLRVKTLSNLSKLEGLSPVTVNGKRKLLFVFDDGDADKDRAGHYAIADYSLVEPYNP